MKINKNTFLNFLKKVEVEGLNKDVLIQADGKVVDFIGSEVGINGNCPFDFGEVLAIMSLDLLLKIVSSFEGDELEIIISNKTEMLLTDKGDKYNFRLADPSIFTVIPDMYDKMRRKMVEGATKLELSYPVISQLQKAISNLSSERISLYCANGKMEAVIIDAITKSSAVVELGACNTTYKQDFRCQTLNKLLDIIGGDGATLYFANGYPLFIALPDNGFIYSLSYVVESR